jgi:hypothetical protein
MAGPDAPPAPAKASGAGERSPRLRCRSRRVVHLNGSVTVKRKVRIAFVRCWPSKTMNGSSAAATSARPPSVRCCGHPRRRSWRPKPPNRPATGLESHGPNLHHLTGLHPACRRPCKLHAHLTGSYLPVRTTSRTGSQHRNMGSRLRPAAPRRRRRGRPREADRFLALADAVGQRSPPRDRPERRSRPDPARRVLATDGLQQLLGVIAAGST